MNTFTEDLTRVLNGFDEAKVNCKSETLKFPMIETKKLNNTDVNILPLNPRAENALKREDILTLKDLFERWEDLPKIRNLGVGTVKLIKKAVYEYYYSTLEQRARTYFWQRFVELNADL